MINITGPAEYMMIVLHFMTWTLLLCGGMVWLERKENPQERKILTFTYLLAGLMMLLRILVTYREGIPDAYPVLPIRNLYGGLWALLIIFIYPIEAANPGWLNLKRILILFSPLIGISILLAVIPFNFIELYSWSDVVANIKEFNVWFRLVMLFVVIIPYMLMLLLIPYNWRHSSVDLKWIRIYVIGAQGISVLYIWFMLSGSLFVSCCHLTYCTLFFTYIAYQELYLRLLPDVKPTVITEAYTQTSPNGPSAINQNLHNAIDKGGLWERFVNYMKFDEPWRSPNITISEVAKAIGVSRTALSAEITKQGIHSFYDLLASYRVGAFCEMAKKGEVTNVNEALFLVGFRSRSTAYERFKEQRGTTPAEYIKTIKNL